MMHSSSGGRVRQAPGLYVLLLVILSGAGICVPIHAQLPPAGARSYSGQFVLTGPSIVSFSSEIRRAETNASTIDLSPMLLPISCERIKQALLRELGANSVWQGKILLFLRPAVANDPGILVTAERYQSSWQYRIELPTPVDRTLYTRSIVLALLMEMANRSAGEQGAEIPAWLVEGLTRDILSSRELEVILSPPEAGKRGVAFSQTFVSKVQESPLKRSHEVLRATLPMSFDELSWPPEGSLAGERADRFIASSHLFVAELLKLPTGKTCMRGMIDALPQHENWQFAFFQAFRPYFQAPLDVEKWWTLQTVYFTGRDIAKCWNKAESHAKLREALQVPTKVHRGTNSLPSAESVPLQTVLREWDDTQQKIVLERKARELEMLRLRVATELVELVERYRVLLLETLDRRAHAGLPFGLRKAAGQANASMRAAQELDLLDGVLASFAPQALDSPTPVAGKES